MSAVFLRLKALREFERRNLPFLRTGEDYDLVCAIGLHQGQGKPLTVKQLFMLGLGSVPTVQRRLANLRRAGVVQQRRCEHDRRSVEVLISPKALKAFAEYEEFLGGT